MANLDTGPVWKDIGHLIAAHLNVSPDGAVLYAEIANRAIRCAIYRELGKLVVYRPCSNQLKKRLRDTRSMEEPGKRWSAATCEIVKTRFHVKLDYPDHLTPVETFGDRRRRLIETRFKGKQITILLPDA